ncbi:hypothetical protein F66182_3556 [Fusarium sp. NRRL 66182]|nr:hypothetical protein F66182_3556 [Fusarium sp. NRRL 66182]
MAPLHYAAPYGNADATKMLLEENADAGIPTTPSEVDGSTIVGLAPLALALMRKGQIIPKYLEGGKEDTKIWNERFDYVIKCLIQKDDETGPGASEIIDLKAWKESKPEDSRMLNVTNMSLHQDGDKDKLAQWLRILVVAPGSASAVSEAVEAVAGSLPSVLPHLSDRSLRIKFEPNGHTPRSLAS